eukprot:Clim_evm54s157 gene=Clim_evmTU54s157
MAPDSLHGSAPAINMGQNPEDILARCKPGTLVWIKDTDEGWAQGEILSIDGASGLIKARDPAGSEVTLSVTPEKNEHPVLVRTTGPSEGLEDMTQLPYLHEPAVLQCLHTRYEQSQIYTFSGIVLVAVNPFSHMEGLYATEMIDTYRGSVGERLDPHLFAVAEAAYVHIETTGQSQSVIVSGESGAGKTVSAKYMMRYLSTVGGVEYGSLENLRHAAEDSERMETQILASNPIFEAFGNAKTTRNDNSSRFGKFLKIFFNKDNKIFGASTQTYLLEKSRVVLHAKQERSFHILYQLLAGLQDLSESQQEELALPSSNPADYAFTVHGTPTVKDVDDRDEFAEMLRAMQTLNFSDEEQNNILKVLAAVLHMGNIKISAKKERAKLENVQEGKEAESPMGYAARLLGLDLEQFEKWILKRRIRAVRDVVESFNNAAQAQDLVQSLAKNFYSMCFDYVVSLINRTLETNKIRNDTRFIGILDIYGFESFEKNSFEQFCINYANENLQQEFARHVFKLEQEEYIAEGIPWEFIAFNDNEECINLIEGKLGILSLLDEECRKAKGTNESFGLNLQANHKNNDFFAVPKLKNGVEPFIVKHYAGSVMYDCYSFVEKNKDQLNEDIKEVIKASTSPFVQNILKFDPISFPPDEDEPEEPSGRGKRKRIPTVGSQFRTSLTELMKTLYGTETHYVRCIKPNMEKAAWVFDRTHVLSQLRACGVLETIRISAAGFPNKKFHDEFVTRYRPLLKGISPKEDNLEECVRNILEQYCTSEDGHDRYQIGKTKVFLRAGELPLLEDKRSERFRKAAVMIQSNYRAHYHQKRFVRIRRTALALQTWIRGGKARHIVQDLREARAATMLAAWYRGCKQRLTYKQQREAVILLQSLVRVRMAKEEVAILRAEKYAKIQEGAALKIQGVMRVVAARTKFLRTRSGIVQLQSHFRRRQAKKEFIELRKEARSVTKLQETKFALENTVMNLTRELDSVKAERDAANAEIVQLKAARETETNTVADIKEELETIKKADSEKAARIGALETEIEQIDLARTEKDAEMESVRSQLVELTAKFVAMEALFATTQSALEEMEEAKKEPFPVKHIGTDVMSPQPVEGEENMQEMINGLRKMGRPRVNTLDRIDDSVLAMTAVDQPTEDFQKELEEDYINRTPRDLSKTSKATSDAQAEVNGASAVSEAQNALEQENKKLEEELEMLREELRSLREKGSLEEGSASSPGVFAKRQNPRQAMRNIKEKIKQGAVGVANEGRRAYGSFRGTPDSNGNALSATGLGDPLQVGTDPLTSAHGEVDSDSLPDGVHDFREPDRATPQPKAVMKESRNRGLSGNTTSSIIMAFKYHESDINRLRENLEALDPRDPMVNGKPVVAQVILHCVRYDIYMNRIEQMERLTDMSLNLMRRQFGANSCILRAFWLANTCHLLAALKLDQPVIKNTTQMFQHLLMEHISEGFQALLEKMMADLNPLIPALLDEEARSDAAKTGGWMRMVRNAVTSRPTMANLVALLDSRLRMFQNVELEPSIIYQLYQRVIEGIDAFTLNRIIMRRDYCTHDKGKHIEANVMRILRWVKTGSSIPQELMQDTMSNTLAAVYLLIGPKRSADDVDVIIDNVSPLNGMQAQRILNHYHHDTYDDPVNPQFKKELLRRLGFDRNESVVMKRIPLTIPPIISVKKAVVYNTNVPRSLANADILEEFML